MGFHQWCHPCLWSCQHKSTSTPQWPPNHSAELLYWELLGSYQFDHYWLFVFQALNSCGDLSKGWRNQLHLGVVPKCGHLRLRVSDNSVDQHRGLLAEVMDKLGHGSGMESPWPQTAGCMSPAGSYFFSLKKYRPSELSVPMIVLTWGNLLI